MQTNNNESDDDSETSNFRYRGEQEFLTTNADDDALMVTTSSSKNAATPGNENSDNDEEMKGTNVTYQTENPPRATTTTPTKTHTTNTARTDISNPTDTANRSHYVTPEKVNETEFKPAPENTKNIYNHIDEDDITWTPIKIAWKTQHLDDASTISQPQVKHDNDWT